MSTPSSTMNHAPSPNTNNHIAVPRPKVATLYYIFAGLVVLVGIGGYFLWPQNPSLNSIANQNSSLDSIAKQSSSLDNAAKKVHVRPSKREPLPVTEHWDEDDWMAKGRASEFEDELQAATVMAEWWDVGISNIHDIQPPTTMYEDMVASAIASASGGDAGIKNALKQLKEHSGGTYSIFSLLLCTSTNGPHCEKTPRANYLRALHYCPHPIVGRKCCKFSCDKMFDF
ncbi:hypothetical protein BU16DRAFT_531396 [Lophium mytilinum]|uniref:Uncharacterized protein n=1 Tax=Lophium mytilinum TaxID=390894 RepID=A0A6A6QEY9_9PEZI|nr:hypothetical protein BU16DRAFT_531396 [Lophium mytilinum]